MKPVFVIISQVYVPDPAAVGQYLADAAAEMARRGYRTIVYTSRNGYEDSAVVFPKREVIDGVEVRRLPWSSFGKGSVKVRLIAQIIFLLQAMVRAMFVPGLKGLMVSTSPPACGIGGAIVSLVRRVPIKFWVMDLNPDQLVVMKVVGPKSFPVRLFDAFNLAILKRASDIVVLDRFMAERVQRKADVMHKMQVLPPWPQEGIVQSIPHASNPFRQQHVPAGKFVLMYSGNHSPANPLSTLLAAAQRLHGHPRLQVMCIGGGQGKKEVEACIAAGASHIVSMPYQPLDQIKYSLSAADVHVVAMGDNMVGIVHPCKVYGVMAAARPMLLLGPAQCHIADLIDRHQLGWRVSHGDVDGAERVLRAMLDTPAEELQAMGQRAAAALAAGLNKQHLLGEFCDVLQRGLPAPPQPAGRLSVAAATQQP
jgi:hypothetical protein